MYKYKVKFILSQYLVDIILLCYFPSLLVTFSLNAIFCKSKLLSPFYDFLLIHDVLCSYKEISVLLYAFHFSEIIFSNHINSSFDLYQNFGSRLIFPFVFSISIALYYLYLYYYVSVTLSSFHLHILILCSPYFVTFYYNHGFFLLIHLTLW